MDPRLQQALAALATSPSETLWIADEVLVLGARDGLSAARSPDETLTLVYAYRVRGQALRPLGRHAEAVESFAEAAIHARAIDDRALAAQVQVGSIDSLGMLGRFGEAVALAQELERDLRTAGQEEAAGKVLFNLGGLLYRQDQHRAALESFEQAGEIFARSSNAALLLPHVQTNIALVLTSLDRTDEALALYERAQEAFLAGEMPVEAATVEANIGFLHFVSGRYVAALASLNRARETFRQQGRLHEAARYTIDAGDAYRALNLVPEARAAYEEALEIFDRLPLDYDEGRARLGWAATLSEATDAAAFSVALDRAESIFRAQRISPQRAHVLLVKAAIVLRSGDAPTAHKLAEAARRRFSGAGMSGWAAEASLLAVTTNPPRNNTPVRRLQRIRRVARQTGRGWLECRALHALGREYEGQGKTAAALRCFRESVVALEQVRTHLTQEELHAAFLSDKLAIYEDLVARLLARGRARDIAEAFEQVEGSRSRLLLERVLSTLPAEQTTLPANLRTRLADLRAQISRAYHQEVALGDDNARRLTVTDSAHLSGLERSYRRLLRDAEIEQGSHSRSVGLLLSPVTVEEM